MCVLLFVLGGNFMMSRKQLVRELMSCEEVLVPQREQGLMGILYKVFGQQ